MWAGILLALGAIAALLMRAKGVAGGARKARLKAAKARLEAGIEAMNAKRAATEAALAHEHRVIMAKEAGRVRREQERQEPDATTADSSKSNMDNELDKG